MHELAITQNIIDIAVSQAQDRKITGINLVIGELSSVVEDSIRFCFDVISKETPAEGATIAIVRVRAVLRCVSCGHELGWTWRVFAPPAASAAGK